LLYPLCSTPLSRSPRCEFSQSFSTTDGSILSRTNRPRELRITPTSSSSLMIRTTDNTANNTPSKHTSCTYPTSFRLHGSSGNSTPVNVGANTSVIVDELLPMNSTSNSRKMMVAPQPQNSHHRERNDSSCKNSNHIQQRRQSVGALIPAYHISAYGDNWRSRDHDSPPIDQQFVVDDRRTKNNNDMRVAVLEQRVRELEAAVVPGQVPSTSVPATSFIIPVIGSKNSSRILRSASSQFVVATSPVTQQLMAQEVVDKEIEVERLQSQLRKCYSRMELRQVQYDEEVNAFRRESEEAKLQLTKVKSRLSELEKECMAYREKAMAIDANRNSAVASSLEKISAQEREIATLRNDLEQHMQLVKNLERMKKEYEFLELQNEALNAKLDSKEATIRDLEDNILAMKMDTSRKIESGSVTPKADAVSFFDVEHAKFLSNSKESNARKTKGNRLSLSSSSVAAVEEDLESSKEVTKSSFVLLCNSDTDGKVQLSSSTSKLIRMQLNITLECRLLAKCLKDVAAKAINGDAPSVNRLLGCRSDSMSESEPEPVMNDASVMSSNCAERYIKKITKDLERIEKDLNSLRESFVEYYQKKIADELKEDESCRIQ
uniref:Uncharacterized protein n=1 Tax=Onchocerca volvulus TaxID=6282 RepID=A0A8R1TWQ7_ONCVO